MKIVIENTEFPYDLGCRLIKLKYENCPFPDLEDIWDSIKPMTFREIAEIENIETRRIGMLCLGIDRMISEVNPKLIDSTTIEKSTTYIDASGKLTTKKFSDTYELYQIEGSNFGKDRWQRTMDDYFFVKFKDTSTDRSYVCWIEPNGVFNTNRQDGEQSAFQFSTTMENLLKSLNAVKCIAWTFQTNVPKGNIEKIIRQGDCILIKPKDKNVLPLETPRHLTEEEYLTLLVAES